MTTLEELNATLKSIELSETMRDKQTNEIMSLYYMYNPANGYVSFRFASNGEVNEFSWLYDPDDASLLTEEIVDWMSSILSTLRENNRMMSAAELARLLPDIDREDIHRLLHLIDILNDVKIYFVMQVDGAPSFVDSEKMVQLHD